ncbi:hypothetical protein K7711_46675 [Nocardia sp. CA2R105]|uniref:hypothetical protein n=1 Tax=Nocardia coffeae TaxID=2873381 RepID=UPI001CA5F642|nr:hypothetical protein [Nocardia coffeae]MBY8864018.1 hypothetical protein [Nocardia coffeae]
MRNVIMLVVGMVVLVLGAQGGIRLVVDHGNTGLLGWLPGGFAARLVCYVVIAAVGVALASWGKRRSDNAGADE